MKKFFTLFLLLFSAFTITGCTPSNVVEEPVIITEEPKIIVEDIIQVDINDFTFDLKDYVSVEDSEDKLTTNDLDIDLNDFNYRKFGEYTVTISVTDSDNNKTDKSIILSVGDYKAPTISLLGEENIYIAINCIYVEQGVALQDNYDAILTPIITGNIDTSVLGEYTVYYKTVDNAGNESETISRTVHIVESDSPFLEKIDENNNNQSTDITEDGLYVTRDEVALYIFIYHTLPNNYMTKSEADTHISDHWTSTNMASIGGDRFYNREGLLPEASGRYYTEVDIDYYGGSRGAKRIVYSNDGFIFYTGDHYGSFTLYDPITKTWNNYSKSDEIFDGTGW